MVSPEHIDEQKPEDKQALSPVEEQHVLPASEIKSPWMEPLLRVVAIVVSLIGGFASVYLMALSFTTWLENPPSDRLGFLVGAAYLLAFLVGVGGAVLFRSWWAVLIIPLALGLGAGLTYFLIPNLIPIKDEYYHYLVYGGAGIETWSWIPFVVIIGALIGSYLGRLWKKRLPL
jgi:MFS family permease